MNLRLYLCAIAAALSLDVEAAWAQLSGLGGPVRALAISADGKSVLSGSFDTSAIRWSLATDSAEQVLRFHSDAVNAVVFLQDGRSRTRSLRAIAHRFRDLPSRPTVRCWHPHPGIAPCGFGRLVPVRSACWRATCRTSTALPSCRTENRWSASVTTLR